jgi:hypothetical protein
MKFKRTFTMLSAAALTVAAAGSARAQALPHFVAPQTYVSNGNAIDGPTTYWSASGDFDGDGYVDLAAADNRSINNTLGFAIAPGRANGGFDPPIAYSVGAFIRVVRAADFNGDGRADLLLVPISGLAAVLPGNADRTFGSPIQIAVPLSANDATLADFNGDGRTDIVFPGDRGYAVVLGNGDGTFGAATLLAETTPSYWAVAGDFDHDGLQDFTGAGGIFGHTYRGNGNGLFQPPMDTGFSATSGTVSGDFNGDGNIDMITRSATPRQDGSNYGFKIAVGFGDGTFSAYIGYVLGQQPIGNLVAGDFNGDGVSDLAMYITATGSLRVMAGDPQRWIAGDIYNSPAVKGTVLFGTDVDGNGSSDLVLSNFADFTVFRSTHGNPPLLAATTLTPAFVVGGTPTTGVVQLGGAAPEAGTTVTLSLSDSSVASLPSGSTVTIPAGASSAAFTIATRSVAAAATVTVTAEAGGVTHAVPLGLVPAYTLSGLSIDPGSQYGIFAVRGTITLSNPADAAATVLLSSANPAIASVPASVNVPAGATSVDFTVALSAVRVDSPVTISAARGDVTATASITVLAPRDTVSIDRAILTRKTGELRVDALSSSSTTTITVYDAASGALLGTLSNAGNGRYKGSVTLFAPQNGAAPVILLKSALGGSASGAVQLK